MNLINPHTHAKTLRLPRFYQAIAMYRKFIQIQSRSVMPKKGEKAKDCFGSFRSNESREAEKRMKEKASAAEFKPGAIAAQRYIDPLDYEQWEQQRAERKAKKHTLDPYR